MSYIYLIIAILIAFAILKKFIRLTITLVIIGIIIYFMRGITVDTKTIRNTNSGKIEFVLNN